MHLQSELLLVRQLAVLHLLADRAIMLIFVILPGIALALATFAGFAQVFSP